jgi:hypothetical protein
VKRAKQIRITEKKQKLKKTKVKDRNSANIALWAKEVKTGRVARK